ncbi:hypothetical protein CTI12_AA033800 [Artemisia annua]|uniref:Uncharacterized protein n=1 Tax=Artemisia annua TaxID=35608 RepID=A0A2U1QG53_ARTAN|nr:hypothetical protein CTI12_AA033800 [Artemisia annua]
MTKLQELMMSRAPDIPTGTFLFAKVGSCTKMSNQPQPKAKRKPNAQPKHMVKPPLPNVKPPQAEPELKAMPHEKFEKDKHGIESNVHPQGFLYKKVGGEAASRGTDFGEAAV